MMQTYAIDGKEFTVNIRHGYRNPVRAKFSDLAQWDFVHARDKLKRHQANSCKVSREV
ncbi:MAG TPA: hypothetical protein VGT03_12455 [Candidatus Acidoferrales bacterium]|nr:hypothetical protein [Candidatus Acidoferrales bacterium]